MTDWAEAIADEIISRKNIIQVWPSAGYCKKCNMPIQGAAVHLVELKKAIADELKKAKP